MSADYTPPKTWHGTIGRPYVTVSPSSSFDGSDYGAFTPGTTTSGIQEALNYAYGLAPMIPEVHLLPGKFSISSPIMFKITSAPSWMDTSTNNSVVYVPGILGVGKNGQSNWQPSQTTISCSSSFPSGEYAIAYIITDSPFVSGATNPQFGGGELANFTLDCADLAAGICLFQYGNSNVHDIAIINTQTADASTTAGISTDQKDYQTGSLVYYMTSDSGEFTPLSNIQLRGGTRTDGFVVYAGSGGGLVKLSNCWDAGGTTRYGFYLLNVNLFPIEVSSCEADIKGGWTGTVPTGYPQAAGFALQGNKYNLTGVGTFVGAPSDGPFVWAAAPVSLTNCYLQSTNGSHYCLESSGNSVFVRNCFFYYDSTDNGAVKFTNATNNHETTVILEFDETEDTNSGTPSYPPINVNWGSSPPWETTIRAVPWYDNQGRYCGGYPASMSTNPPVSGTVYQNQNPFIMEIRLPVTYSPTSTAAATLVPALGYSSTPTDLPKESEPAGLTTGTIRTYVLRVPAGYYYSFTATNATLGTASVLTE